MIWQRWTCNRDETHKCNREDFAWDEDSYIVMIYHRQSKVSASVFVSTQIAHYSLSLHSITEYNEHGKATVFAWITRNNFTLRNVSINSVNITMTLRFFFCVVVVVVAVIIVVSFFVPFACWRWRFQIGV